MHEWSIAEGIISAVLREAEGAKKVKEVEVRVGELRDLNLEILSEAVSVISKGTIAEGARYRFTEKPASFKCVKCGVRWGMREALREVEKRLPGEGYIMEEEPEPPIHFLPTLIAGLQRCPRCGGMDIVIESGQELELVKILVEVE